MSILYYNRGIIPLFEKVGEEGFEGEPKAAKERRVGSCDLFNLDGLEGGHGGGRKTRWTIGTALGDVDIGSVLGVGWDVRR